MYQDWQLSICKREGNNMGKDIYSDENQAKMQKEQRELINKFTDSGDKIELNKDDKVGLEARNNYMVSYIDADTYKFDMFDNPSQEEIQILTKEELENREKWIKENKEKRWASFYQKGKEITDREEIVKKSSGFWIFRSKTTKRAENELKELKKKKIKQLRVFQHSGVDMSNDMLSWYNERMNKYDSAKKKELVEKDPTFLKDIKDKTFDVLGKTVKEKDKNTGETKKVLKYNYMSEKLITDSKGKEGSVNSISKLNQYVADLLTFKKEDLNEEKARMLVERYQEVVSEQNRYASPHDTLLRFNKEGICRDPQSAYLMLLASSTTVLCKLVDSMDKTVEVDPEMMGILIGIRATAGFASYVIASRQEFKSNVARYEQEVADENDVKFEKAFEEASKGLEYIHTYSYAIKRKYSKELRSGTSDSLRTELISLNDKLAARHEAVRIYSESHARSMAADLPMVVENVIAELDKKLSQYILEDDMWKDVDNKFETNKSKSVLEGNSKVGISMAMDKLLKGLDVDASIDENLRFYQKRKDYITGKLGITDEKTIKELWQSKKIQDAIIKTESEKDFEKIISDIEKNYKDNLDAVELRLNSLGALGKELLRFKFGIYMGSAYLLGSQKQVLEEFDYYRKNFYKINSELENLDKKFANVLKKYNCDEKYWPHFIRMIDKEFMQRGGYIGGDMLDNIVKYVMTNVDSNLPYLNQLFGEESSNSTRVFFPDMWENLQRLAFENAYMDPKAYRAVMLNEANKMMVLTKNRTTKYQVDSMTIGTQSQVDQLNNDEKAKEISSRKMQRLKAQLEFDKILTYSQWLAAKEKEKEDVKEVEEKGYVPKFNRLLQVFSGLDDNELAEYKDYQFNFNMAFKQIIENNKLGDKFEFMKNVSTNEDLDKLSELEYKELENYLRENARRVANSIRDCDDTRKKEIYENLMEEILLGSLDDDYDTVQYTLDKVKQQSRHKRNILRTRALIGMRLAEQKEGTVQYDYLSIVSNDKKSKNFFPAERREKFVNARKIWDSLATAGDAQNADLASEFRTMLMSVAFEFESKYKADGDKYIVRSDKKTGVLEDTSKSISKKEYNKKYKAAMLDFLGELANKKYEKKLTDKYALNSATLGSIRDVLAQMKQMKNQPGLELLLCGEEEFLLSRGCEGEDVFTNINDEEYQDKLLALSRRTMKREEDLQKVINYRHPKNKDGEYTKEQLEARKSEYRKMRRNVFEIPDESAEATEAKATALIWITRIRDLMISGFEKTKLKGLSDFEPYREFLSMTSSEIIRTRYSDLNKLLENIFVKAQTELLPYLKQAPELLSIDKSAKTKISDICAMLTGVLADDMYAEVLKKMMEANVEEEQFYEDNRKKYGFSDYREALVYMDEYMNLPQKQRELEDKRIDCQMEKYNKNMLILESFENGSYAILKDVLPKTDAFWENATELSYTFKRYLREKVKPIYGDFVKEAAKYDKEGKQYLIEMYIAQNLDEIADIGNRIVNKDYWKNDIKQFENDIFNKKINKVSINDRLAALKKKGLTSEEENALRLGAAKEQSTLEKLLSDEGIKQALANYKANLETAKNADVFVKNIEKERMEYMFRYAVVDMINMDPKTFKEKVSNVAWLAYDSYYKYSRKHKMQENEKETETSWMAQSKEDMLFRLQRSNEYATGIRNETLALLQANRELELSGQTVITNIYGGQREIKSSEEVDYLALIGSIVAESKLSKTPAIEQDVKKIAREIYFSNETKKWKKEKKQEWLKKLVADAVDAYNYASKNEEFTETRKHDDRFYDKIEAKKVVDRNCRKFVLFAAAMRKIPGADKPDYNDIAKEFWARQDAVNRLGKIEYGDGDIERMALDDQNAAQIMMFTLEQGRAFQDRVNTMETRLQGFKYIDRYVSEYINEHKEYSNLNADTKKAVKRAMRDKVSSYVVDMDSVFESENMEEIKRVVEETMSNSYLISAAKEYQSILKKEQKDKVVVDENMGLEQFDAFMTANLGFFNRRKYKSLDEDRKRVLALNIIMQSREVNSNDNTMQLVHEGTAANKDANDVTFEQMIRVLKRQDYLNGDKENSEREKIEFGKAAEAMQGLNSNGKTLLFERALEMTLFAEKRWDTEPVANFRMLDNPNESIRIAKVAKSNNKLSKMPQEVADDVDFKNKLVELLKADKKNSEAEKIEKMDQVSIQLLITILQNRSVVDITTNKNSKGIVNVALNRKIQKMVLEKGRDDYKKEAQIGSNCERAMRTLFSFQLRDDIRHDMGNMSENDLAAKALSRSTAIDIELLKRAIDFKEKLDKVAISKVKDTGELNILADGFYDEMLSDDKKSRSKEWMKDYAKKVVARYNFDRDEKVKNVDIFADKNFDEEARELWNLKTEEERKKKQKEDEQDRKEWDEIHSSHLDNLEKIKLG